MVGTTVSHYKILEHLGGGGMGVVYKAEDTKLKRTVALKFLPPDLTRDPQAKERFIHEAQAASALQHNNICNVHDVDESSDGQLFIVMDLYEGETLKKMIERGALPIDQAVDIALQVGRGLSRAHEAGIIHRDVKPANIMVTNRGEAKVVDFGLAKLSGRTLLTKTGTTMGTAAYMSPEQARGESVDHRTDIWSLGVVLYEMLTGKRPFAADYENALIYLIINSEPEQVTKARKDVPSGLGRIVTRAMAKDPSDRYRSMMDLLTDLSRLATGDTTPRAIGLDDRRFPRASRRRMPFFGAIIGCLILLAALATMVFLPAGTKIRLNPNATTRTLYAKTYVSMAYIGVAPPTCFPGISADGNWISFGAPNDSGKWDVYFMNLAWSGPRKIPVPDTLHEGRGTWIARISPHGEAVLFITNDQPVVGSTSGGETRAIVSFDTIEAIGGWTPDGKRILFFRLDPSERFTELWSIRADGTDSRHEFTDSQSVAHWHSLAASLSPDGRSVAWVRNFKGEYAELITRDLQSGVERQLTFDRKDVDEPYWLSNGLILFSSNRSGKVSYWAIPESGGEAVQLTPTGGENLGVSATLDGKRILLPESDARANLWIRDIGGTKLTRTRLDLPVSIGRFAMSPDFRSIAYAIAEPGESGRFGLWVAESDGQNRRRIGSINTTDWNPLTPPYLTGGGSWSPDGKWIAYRGNSPDGTRGIMAVEVAASGTPKRVFSGAEGPYRWVDQKHLAVLGTDNRTYICSIDGDPPRQFFEDSTFAYPIQGGKYVEYFRFGTEFCRAITQMGADGKRAGTPRELPSWVSSLSYDGTIWLGEKKPGELWKLTLPALKEEYIGPVGMIRFPFVSADGNQIAYLTHECTMRLSLIENLFE